MTEIKAFEGQRSCVLTLDPGLAFFDGHFPDQAILPAAIALELTVLVVQILYQMPEAQLSEVKRSKILQNLLAGDRVRIELNRLDPEHFTATWYRLSDEPSELAIDWRLTLFG